MPVDLSGLSKADSEDFLGRLSTYEMDASAVHQEELVVSPSSRVYLSMAATRPSLIKPRILETHDLAKVKRWIGVPDRIFDRRVLPSRMPISRFPLPSMLRAQPELLRGIEAGSMAEILRRIDPARLTSEDRDNVLQAARAYVRGDSRLVATYEPLVEAVISVFRIPIWIFVTVKVQAGSVLEFGPGANVLAAWRVIIEEGGTIRSHGSLTLNCTHLEKV